MASQAETLKLQARFNSSLSLLQPESAPKPVRQMPIVRRPENDLRKQALSNAATALARLWKVR